MGITTLIEKNIDEMIDGLVAVCKSDSGKCGKILRDTHKALGQRIGSLISEQEDAKKYAVVILMRAGLPFGLGIADGLEVASRQAKIYFSTKEKEVPESLNSDKFDRIILADAVIESGNSILGLADKITVKDKIIFATNVLSSKAVERFTNYNLYTTRVSQISFKGAMQKTISSGKGPDTGERLFDSDF